MFDDVVPWPGPIGDQETDHTETVCRDDDLQSHISGVTTASTGAAASRTGIPFKCMMLNARIEDESETEVAASSGVAPKSTPPKTKPTTAKSAPSTSTSTSQFPWTHAQSAANVAEKGKGKGKGKGKDKGPSSKGKPVAKGKGKEREGTASSGVVPDRVPFQRWYNDDVRRGVHHARRAHELCSRP